VKRRTRAVSVALLTASLAGSSLLVSGCGSTNASTAATVGTEVITNAQLSDWVHGVLVATGKSPNSIDQNVTSKSLNLLIYVDLINALAGATGVTASQGEVDAAAKSLLQAGATEEQIKASAAQSGIAPDAIPAFLRANVLTPKIQKVLSPNATTEEAQTIFQQALATTARVLGVTVNPRYGSWSPDTIKLGAPPSDLSIPPAD
jgi:hypothetical protein